ncbi:MAG TPA: 50S ribosomal protein L23 [Candidatus Nanoarchaeia archaeon]|nr:50S ribosomal protein L23 [Candidatus Nanoarchaeia archaeon]
MIIKYPLSTEQALGKMDSENKLVFIVDRKATKPEIKKEIEQLLQVKIQKVNTLIDQSGNKKAYVRFAPGTRAIDVATKLGMM